MKNKILIIIAVLLTVITGCRKTEADLSAEVGPAPQFDTRTELGRKMQEMFNKYGIIFEYKWNRFAYAPNVVADPAREADVLPYIELLEELFFKAMDSVSGPGITSTRETPVRILLIGSGINYGGAESFGESTAGQAGNIQPNRLTLGGLTSFGTVIRAKSATSDANYLRAIYDAAPSSFPNDAGLIGFVYHEYTHYLDSKHQIPLGFEYPARTEYLRGSNQYQSVPLTTAIARGFFIPYGMQNEHEDFATYVQTMIWKTQEVLNSTYLTNNATREKYKLVTKYFENLKIPIDSLKAYLNKQSVKDRLIQLKRKYE
ncbi:putative zinc-binding metallopeptidase [Polluticaenibacter yanchengensis]|uniref:Zinc-binding metallopeptidase n=1 Tax=Polluticaenibacter yanchengensis TaxID=3014562 RepID=A0ABT4UKS4_9BACT|nr:putative zinc-binding metallopeptidase [Chitinophagaceae bacterium LY-5]